MATMGLRRRVPPVPSTSSGKRGRSDNNNSPSQGNLNKSSPEPPAPKKTRSSSRPQANKSLKELDLKKMASAGPPLWSDPRPYASIAGLSIEAQRALCAEGLASPMYMSPAMATFVGAAAAGLGKVAPNAVSTYLDISNMTSAAAVAAAGRWPASATTATSSTPADEPVGSKGPPSEGGLPATFPDDGMFGAYQPWVIKTYGDLAKTKTITIKKYGRILRTLRGEEANSAENSKFRFWVKSKGFHIGQPEGYEPKPADRIVGRHAVTAPGLDPPLYVPTQPPHNKVSTYIISIRNFFFFPPSTIYNTVFIADDIIIIIT
ncbi:uncharacterized protein LOC106641179 [Copidosoma floridanum]|uniref:uncharacterized protein LOC106641179 n=1 Tax=Copidosoma floridanum TaxID=29053 RepID=UPI0006C9AE97|nr:uncharacterized protein LOC106641179 [Copidosoma floridanum]XP_014210966.1 uncharacterized protein LOC106641179 [Copidosoma floridanum]